MATYYNPGQTTWANSRYRTTLVISFGTPNTTARTVTATATFRLTAKSGSGFDQWSLWGDLELNGTDTWDPGTALYKCVGQTITLKTSSVTLSYPDTGTGPSFSVRAYVEMRNQSQTFSLPPMTISKSESAPNIAAKTVTYTATFNANGGSVTPTSQTYTVGGSNLTAPTPTRTGYDFLGWTDDSTGVVTLSGGSSYSLSQNKAFTASWAQRFTVSFNYNGGSGTTTSLTGSSVKLPTPSARTNFSFNGWFTATSGGTKIGNANATYSPTAAITLYAQWTQTAIPPVFEDISIMSPAFLGRPYETTGSSNNTVFATNTTSYAVLSPSPAVSGHTDGLPPGISISTVSGVCVFSGTPTTLGNFAFRIRATSSTSTTVDSTNIILSVVPPIKRMTGSATNTQVTTFKRFVGVGLVSPNAQGVLVPADAQGYVNVSRIMRHNGSTSGNPWVNEIPLP